MGQREREWNTGFPPKPRPHEDFRDTTLRFNHLPIAPLWEPRLQHVTLGDIQYSNLVIQTPYLTASRKRGFAEIKSINKTHIVQSAEPSEHALAFPLSRLKRRKDLGGKAQCWEEGGGGEAGRGSSCLCWLLAVAVILQSSPNLFTFYSAALAPSVKVKRHKHSRPRQHSVLPISGVMLARTSPRP